MERIKSNTSRYEFIKSIWTSERILTSELVEISQVTYHLETTYQPRLESSGAGRTPDE